MHKLVILALLGQSLALKVQTHDLKPVSPEVSADDKVKEAEDRLKQAIIEKDELEKGEPKADEVAVATEEESA